MLIASSQNLRVPITKFQVVGERCSGTNLAQKLIQRNLGLTPALVFDWKHGFPNATVIPNDVLIVACFRNPFDWLVSLHRKPWHTTAKMQALDFSVFIQTPWDTIAEKRYKGLPIKEEEDGLPLQADRHPITGEIFQNPCALRSAKAKAHLGIANRNCNFVALRLEDLQTDPGAVISNLSTAFKITQIADNYKVRRQLGSKYKALVSDRPATPDILSPSDRTIIAENLDAKLEARLGYDIST